MVYLAELLVVVIDRLKIVRIRGRNVPRVHGQKRLDDDTFFASLCLAPGKQRCRVLDAPGAIMLKHKKLSPDNRTCLAVASTQESCRDSMPCSL